MAFSRSPTTTRARPIAGAWMAGYWQTHRSGWAPEDFGEEWDCVICRDCIELNQDDQPMDRPMGALWAFRTLGQASARRYHVTKTHPSWMHFKGLVELGLPRAVFLRLRSRVGGSSAHDRTRVRFALVSTSCRRAIRHMRRSSTGCCAISIPGTTAWSRREVPAPPARANCRAGATIFRRLPRLTRGYRMGLRIWRERVNFGVGVMVRAKAIAGILAPGEVRRRGRVYRRTRDPGFSGGVSRQPPDRGRASTPTCSISTGTWSCTCSGHTSSRVSSRCC
jgi:hypothetical protein